MTKLMLHTPTAREELEKIARQNLQVAQNKKPQINRVTSLFFFCFRFFSTSLSLEENSGHLTRVRHSRCKSRATHSDQCVQYFHVSRQWHGHQCLGFLTYIYIYYAQMLMHATVPEHRGIFLYVCRGLHTIMEKKQG